MAAAKTSSWRGEGGVGSDHVIERGNAGSDCAIECGGGRKGAIERSGGSASAIERGGEGDPVVERGSASDDAIEPSIIGDSAIQPGPGAARPLPLPAEQSLAAGLAAVFGVQPEELVLERRRNPQASTFPGEFVRCQLPDGRCLELCCKYGADESDGCYGHRGNAAYEAAVYRLLMRRGVPGVPCLHGTFAEPAARRTWLVLERVPGLRIDELPDPVHAMRAAAAWAGRLHAKNPLAKARDAGVPLIRHTLSYYLGWIHRTIEFARPLHGRCPWLPELARHADELVAPLLTAPRVLIHGEYYPHNVLVHDGAVFAVDWQSAAVAAGELDLAALTEHWPAEIADACAREYREARWPAGAPASFDAVLEVARIHWLFRWLGDRPQWTLGERARWRWQMLERVAARLGLT
ncbi:MAG TPA: aminoglycoside phosphotransferase family protein [Longimicrobiales bacterium]